MRKLNSIDDSVNNEHVNTNVCISRFDQFSQVSEQEVCKLISGMPSKTCKLDCVPMWLMKEHLNVFLPFITHVINSSFSSAIFPKSMGCALITPILKKPSLDCNDLSNFRPVSNISFYFQNN